MKEPGELEKLNAVAQAEAIDLGFHRSRWFYVFYSAIAVAYTASHRAFTPANAAIWASTVLMLGLTAATFSGWCYSAPVERVLWPLFFLVWALFGMLPAPLEGRIWLVAAVLLFIWESAGAIRMASAMRLASSTVCVEARETIGRWISQLTSDYVAPGVVQFTANDYFNDGQVVARLLPQDDWTVIATVLKNDHTRLITLTILDSSSAHILYSPEQHYMRIGKRKFRKVDMSLESLQLLKQFPQGFAEV
jgi:hypothetical protein